MNIQQKFNMKLNESQQNQILSNDESININEVDISDQEVFQRKRIQNQQL